MFRSDKAKQKDAAAERRAVIEKARLDREKRELDRKTASHAVLLQRFVRGRLASIRVHREWRRACDSQLADLATLDARLAPVYKARGLVFAPPMSAMLGIIRRVNCVDAYDRACSARRPGAGRRDTGVRGGAGGAASAAGAHAEAAAAAEARMLALCGWLARNVESADPNCCLYDFVAANAGTFRLLLRSCLRHLHAFPAAAAGVAGAPGAGAGAGATAGAEAATALPLNSPSGIVAALTSESRVVAQLAKRDGEVKALVKARAAIAGLRQLTLGSGRDGLGARAAAAAPASEYDVLDGVRAAIMGSHVPTDESPMPPGRAQSLGRLVKWALALVAPAPAGDVGGAGARGDDDAASPSVSMARFALYVLTAPLLRHRIDASAVAAIKACWGPLLASHRAHAPDALLPVSGAPSVGGWGPDVWFLGNLVSMADFRAPAAAGSSGGAGAAAPAGASGVGGGMSDRAATDTIIVIGDLVDSVSDSVYSQERPVVWDHKGSSSTPTAMPELLRRDVQLLLYQPHVAGVVGRMCVMHQALLRTPRLRAGGDEGPKLARDKGAGYVELREGDTGAGDDDGGGGVGAYFSRLVRSSAFARKLFGGGAKSKEKSKGQSRAGAAGGGMEDATSIVPGAGAGGEGIVSGGAGGSGVAGGAGGSGTAEALPKAPPGVTEPFNNAGMFAAARLYSLLLRRLPGGVNTTPSVVSAMSLTNHLAFTKATNLVRNLWFCVAESVGEDMDGFLHSWGYPSRVECKGHFAVLALFASTFAHLLIILDDYELYERRTPMPLGEIGWAVALLKAVVARSKGVGVNMRDASVRAKATADPAPYWARFEQEAIRVLRELYERHSRRPVCPSETWLVHCEGDDALTQELMGCMPFAVPFAVRAQLYDRTRETDKAAHQEGHRQIGLTVNRGRIFETGFASLNRLGPELRRKLHVEFVNEHGLAEAGIDAGGLFKEFWTQLSAVAFDPSYGLFMATEANMLYPNPGADVVLGQDTTQLFEFLGRVLGKALYEGVTVQPQFATFFLAKLLHKPTHLHHLPSLDNELYKNLLFLKTYEGDVSDLCLSFTVTQVVAGKEIEQELVPGGADIEVTSRNRLDYIYRVADAHLNRSIKKQSDAFRRGLADLIPHNWLAMFSEPELQVLISGANIGMDIEDLRANVRLQGGFFRGDRTVKRFFEALEMMTMEERAALLRFVTSCERPPPLGFAHLEPKFCLQRIPISSDKDRLPSASTCFNTLKLPTYSSAKVMKEKLLFSARSGAGFEMS